MEGTGILISFKLFIYCLKRWLIKLTSNCAFAIESILSINVKSPIRKLLVLTNKSSSGNLIYFDCKCLELKKQVNTKYTRNKMQETVDIDFSNFIVDGIQTALET